MSEPKITVSPLAQSFTDDRITVDVQIYNIEGNDGWTLEVVVDEETSVVWTELFPTDQEAWDEFSGAVREVGLRRLVEADDGDVATIH